MRCVECNGVINPNDDHHFADGEPPFWVCDLCCKQTNADWEEDKKLLRAQGVEIPCKWARENLGMRAEDEP